MELIIEELLLSLHRLIQILGPLKSESFTKPCPLASDSTIGHQVRIHSDFFQCFLLGIGNGKVDYTAQEDLLEVEQDPVYAAAYIRGICAGIEQLAVDVDLDSPVQIKMPGDDEHWAHSSIRRELQFLHSQTQYHHALVSILLAQQTE